MAVMLLAMPAALWRTWRVGQRRLVLDRAMVQVHASSGMTASVPVGEVLASPQALLIGRVMLPYRGQTATGKPGRWIYDEDMLTRYLLAHLPASHRVAQSELARALMKRMPKWHALGVAGLVLACVLFEIWRLWGRA
jgi:hypothetical protein